MIWCWLGQTRAPVDSRQLALSRPQPMWGAFGEGRGVTGDGQLFHHMTSLGMAETQTARRNLMCHVLWEPALTGTSILLGRGYEDWLALGACCSGTAQTQAS